jgi:uncharacterized protein
MRNSICKGFVYHSRLLPRNHFLKYDNFQILLDLQKLHQTPSLLAINKFGLFSFNEKNYGNKDNNSTSLYLRIKNMMVTQNLFQEGDRVIILTMPAFLGFVFNPISIYFIIAPNEMVRAIIYEVNNTFGDRHIYFGANQDFEKAQSEIKQKAAKMMHVSPFMDMNMEYGFRIRLENKEIKILISLLGELEKKPKLYLNAGFKGKMCQLSNWQLLKCAIEYPFMAIGVVWGIHWQALKIWLKKISYRPKPHGKIATSSKI